MSARFFRALLRAKSQDRSVLRRSARRWIDLRPARCPGTRDVIVSAAFLVYFDPLAGVVAASASAPRPAGRRIFTVA